MSNINPNRYPVDYNGTALTNKVVGEAVTLNTRKVRAFAPLNAPYFSKNIVITDTTTGRPLTSSQYKCFNLMAAPSAIAGAGNEVFSVVVITDQAVGNSLSVDYQTVGGDYVQGFDSIVQMLGALTQDNRPVTWDNILNRDTEFTPNQHLHPLADTVGWEYFCVALEQLKLAILLGDDIKKDFILQYIDAALASSDAAAAAAVSPSSPFGAHVNDMNNPHGVTATELNLGNVQNFAIATLTEVYAGIVTNKYVTVDQVGLAIQNAINAGMDAHIADHDNPHQTDKVKVGLDQVLNLPIAAAEDLSAPDQSNPKYVTTPVLGTWLNSYFAAQQTSIGQAIATVTTSVTTAKTAALAAQAQAQTAQLAAQGATTQTSQAVTAATAALTQAQENAQAVTASQTAAQTLVQQYLVAAVAAARASGYSSGYADGTAAAHS